MWRFQKNRFAAFKNRLALSEITFRSQKSLGTFRNRLAAFKNRLALSEITWRFQKHLGPDQFEFRIALALIVYCCLRGVARSGRVGFTQVDAQQVFENSEPSLSNS